MPSLSTSTPSRAKHPASAAAPRPGGYAGKLLRVNLTTGKIWSEPWSPEDMRELIGGVGLGARILYREVPAHVHWDHPENRLVLATGPLAGLPVWGTGGLTVVTRGAGTDGPTSTQANGFFGANLKYSGYDAIIIQGLSRKWVYLHIHDGLVQAADDIAHDLQTDPTARSLYEYGTLPGVVNLHKLGMLPIKNYTTNVSPVDLGPWEARRLREGFDHRGHQCNACGMHHCHMQVIRSGPHTGTLVDEPEYEGWSGAGWTIGATDPQAVSWLNTELDRAGLDVNEFGWLCGWVMECVEKGYITRAQLGFDLRWGDVEGARKLVDLIVHRRGLGALLAEGVKRAAAKLGPPARDCAVY